MPNQFSMPGVPLVQANLVQPPSVDRTRETRRRPGSSKNDACEFCGKVGFLIRREFFDLLRSSKTRQTWLSTEECTLESGPTNVSCAIMRAPR